MSDNDYIPDDLDMKIIALLQEDGRTPTQDIAKRFNSTSSTIRKRIRRLEETGTMRVVAVTDFAAAGYDLLLAIGIEVESRAAEDVVFGYAEVTTGAGGDIQQVASIARQMVTRFGMSDKLGPVALGRSQGGMFLGRDIAAERDFSEDTAATIDEEVSDLVDVAYKRATKVLVSNRSVLDEIAEMLVEQETVDAEELQELLIRSDVRVAEYV